MPKVEFLLPASTIKGTSKRFINGKRFKSSVVSPLLEIAITTSSLVIIPESPWVLSAGCRKYDGVPVEESVAEIFLPINPDFPIPETITLPFDFIITDTASSILLLILSLSFKTESDSIWKTSFASSFNDCVCSTSILKPSQLIYLFKLYTNNTNKKIKNLI